MRIRTRTAAFASIAALSLVGVACGDDSNDSGSATTAAAGGDTATTMADTATTMEPMGSEPMTSEMGSMPMTSEMGSMPMTSEMGEMMEPSGPGCASVPADGEGSFEGMADDPAATAASNNPELSTLVEAVTAAELVDTLNGPGPFTIFAPANSAFAKIDAATMESVMADPSGALTDILTIHVVEGAMSSTDLVEAGTLEGMNGSLEVVQDGDTVTVDAGGGPATVVCADVPVSNGVVHIIDTVLMPAG